MKHLVYWKGMCKDAKRYLKSCDKFQKCKFPNRTYQGEYESIIPNVPNELCMVDIFGPLPKGKFGYAYVLIAMDAFTKIVKLYGLRRATTVTCLKKIEGSYFENIGKPKSILADHGTQFYNQRWIRRLKDNGVKAVFSSIRHPESNLSERQLKSVGTFLRILCSQNHSSWVDKIQMIEGYINNNFSTATGEIPIELHTQQRVQLPLERQIDYLQSDRERNDCDHIFQMAKERLIKRAEQRKKGHKFRNIVFQVGQPVLIKAARYSSANEKVSAKLMELYTGPYYVVRKLNQNAYELENPVTKDIKIFNIQNLLPYHSRE